MSTAFLLRVKARGRPAANFALLVVGAIGAGFIGLLGLGFVWMSIYDVRNFTVRGVTGEWRWFLIVGAGVTLLALLMVIAISLRMVRVIRENRSRTGGFTE